ncbi:hypothetical protein [Mycolicibacterium wolinskyi]|uniref:hypothetical protein n=1 Tax=Mycolicibacterium wolinskyi TaxID=59750 RepID=UPI003917A0D6
MNEVGEQLQRFLIISQTSVNYILDGLGNILILGISKKPPYFAELSIHIADNVIFGSANPF